MLRRRVIPCLDVADGRVVKGTRFVDLVDEGDPPELAERYAREGADELVFLDISAAPERRGTLLDIVERTARRAFIPLTVGGGVRTVEEMRDVLRAGADKVSLEHRGRRRPDADRPVCGPLREPGRRRGHRCAPARGRLGDGHLMGGRRQGRPRSHRTRSGGLGRAGRRTRCRGAPGHLDRSRRDGRGFRHRPATRHHHARLGAGHRLGRCRGTRRFRGGGSRRRGGCRPRCLDLPPPDPLDRCGQGGHGEMPGCRFASCRNWRHERGGCRGRGGRVRRAGERPGARGALRPRRPRPRRRPGCRRRPRAHARVDGCRGAGRHRRDRRCPFSLTLARPTLAQGRDERQRPAAHRPGRRLRRRRAARDRRPGRPHVPPRHAFVLRSRRRARRAHDAGVRVARNAVVHDRVTRRGAPIGLLHDQPARGRRRRGRSQGHRGGHRIAARRQGRRDRVH